MGGHGSSLPSSMAWFTPRKTSSLCDHEQELRDRQPVAELQRHHRFATTVSPGTSCPSWLDYLANDTDCNALELDASSPPSPVLQVSETLPHNAVRLDTLEASIPVDPYS